MADEELKNGQAAGDAAAGESPEEQPRMPSHEELIIGEILRHSPPWLFSLLFHLLIVLLIYEFSYTSAISERMPDIQVVMEFKDEAVKEEKPEDLFKKEEIKRDMRDDLTDVTRVADSPMDDTSVVDGPEGPGLPFVEDDAPTDDVGIGDAPLDVAKLVPKGDALKLAAIGTGDPGKIGGAFGLRNGGAGHGKALRRGGGTKRTENAVMAGLRWLALHQETDGHWSSQKYGGNGERDLGVTGLALLAFLGAGHTDKEGKYRDNVARALNWLKNNQNADGSFKMAGSVMYGHGIASMASSEAYGMARTPWVGRVAQGAVDFIMKIQPDTGGFDYGGATNREDTSVTGWQLMAVKSGKISGLIVSEGAFDKFRIWLKNALDQNGRTCYAMVAPNLQGAGGSPATTAIGLLGREWIGWKRDDPEVVKIANVVKGDGANIKNLYHLYYGCLSMFQMGGDYWDTWNKAFRDPLVAAQNKSPDPDLDGSWNPDQCTYGTYGGRAYTTAMAVLCLEVYYRYLPVYR